MYNYSTYCEVVGHPPAPFMRGNALNESLSLSLSLSLSHTHTHTHTHSLSLSLLLSLSLSLWLFLHHIFHANSQANRGDYLITVSLGQVILSSTYRTVIALTGYRARTGAKQPVQIEHLPCSACHGAGNGTAREREVRGGIREISA